MEANKVSQDKLEGLKEYWTLIGADFLCSVKRLCRYLELGPTETWQDFGYVPWSTTKYSHEQLLNFVKSPEFVTIFEHHLKLGDEMIKESEEIRERDAKRRRIADEKEEKKTQEENARLSLMTREERKLELEGMKLPDLKNLYRSLSTSGHKAMIVARILEYEMQNNKLKV
jgi:hypothetical protein